jgi:hypothetical protein
MTMRPKEYGNVGFRVCCTHRGLPIQPGSTTIVGGSVHDSLLKVDFVGTRKNAYYDVIPTGLSSERRTKNACLDEGNNELSASE